MKIRITFPQITFDSKEIEISQQEFENLEDYAEFIWSKMSYEEQDWCPDGFKGLNAAMEAEYSKIRIIEK